MVEQIAMHRIAIWGDDAFYSLHCSIHLTVSGPRAGRLAKLCIQEVLRLKGQLAWGLRDYH